jgi:hypothetical protein
MILKTDKFKIIYHAIIIILYLNVVQNVRLCSILILYFSILLHFYFIIHINPYIKFLI